MLWLEALPTYGAAKEALAWGAGGLALAAAALRRRALVLEPPGVVWAAVVALGALGLALGTSDVEAGLDRVVGDAAILAWVLAVPALATRAGERALLLDAAVLGAAVAAMLDLAVVLGVGPDAWSVERPPQGNPMLAGALAAIAAPVAFARMIEARRAGGGRRAAVSYAATFVLLADVGAARSLGGVAAVAAGLAATWVVVGRRPTRRLGVAAACAAAALVVVALTPPLRSTAVDHLARRVHVWTASADAFLEAPLTGHGPGDFDRAYLDAQAERLAASSEARDLATHARRAHASALHRAVEGGFLAAVLFAAALLLGLHRAWRGRHAPALGALTAFAVVASYAFPDLSAPTAVLLALAWAAPPGAAGWRPPIGLSVVLVLLGLAVAGWAATRNAAWAARVAGDPQVALALDPWDPRALFDRALLRRQGGDLAAARSDLAAADHLRASPSIATMLGNTCFHLGDLACAEEALGRVTRWSPRDAGAWYNLARVVLARGAPERAAGLATRALALAPGDPRVRDLARRLGVDAP